MSLDAVVTDVEVTVEDVQRILEIGRILRSVLTEEELIKLEISMNVSLEKIGNTGVS